MRLLIVRHAQAVARGAPGVSDDERPLTKKGTKDFAKVARVLARMTPSPDVILTSPLPRACQTAEIARAAWRSRVRVSEERALAETTVRGFVALLARHRHASVVVIVGHEPSVSALLAHLVGARRPGALAFKKGGAALVETPDPRLRGQGALVWFLPPKLLSAVGGRR